MSEAAKQAAYSAWRFHVWMAKGTWTARHIDKAVAQGVLVPGRCDCGKDGCPYPPRRAASDD